MDKNLQLSETEKANSPEGNLKKNKNKSKIFAFIGVFEIILIIFLIGALFVFLNSLKIIQLGKVFPFLSSLPQIQKQDKNITNVSVFSKNLPPSLPTESINNVDQATKTALYSFVKSNILSKFLDLANAVGTYSENTLDNTSTFSLGRQIDNKSVDILLKMKKSGNDYAMTIRISASTNVSHPITDQQASNLLGEYFINPQTQSWKCSKDNSNSSCSSEKIINNSQKQKFVVKETTDIPNHIFILDCNVFPNSTLYNQSNYCLFDK